ncbi:S-layer homology domain-containing protein [Flavonifractor plautii]|uniref:S-layer homology domain-containing protein n=1 Tax=Flavonifractor plautii TaxID=292800 RepID=UPI001D035B05|nr:S-layer homology domain-containing protein [Flavonifractor plautii]MCB5779149.1 S-layer homology domain-containing protein [Flavonifractor plautii]MCQ5311440.1 S-layer homology domain-containing protein [Flavonifractor plautii]UOX47933.1 S-layer homology domain-containing protein [Flavonifractor plautii]
MRNLKRALSLALAAIMLIGMMVVSASAVSYNDLTDKDQIVNKDAVSMLVSLGIIEGKPDGSYAPTENVDRAQMAKMLSVIMNKGVDNSALYQSVNSGLTDITSHWAKGHINYCYTTGIIAGRGNGTFDPSATVTALEAAKMLLVAVGYDPKIEGFEGADWAINVSVRADEQGIFEGFTKDLSAPLNRDDAALLIYNALDVEMIQSYTTNNYPIVYSDHRTILSDKYGVIKVEGVVTANEWAILDDDTDTALQEGKTRIYNPDGILSTTGNTAVAQDSSANVKTQVFNVSTPVDMLGKAVTMYVKKTTILADSTVYGAPVVSDVNTVIETGEKVTGGDSKDDDSLAALLKGTGLATDKATEYYHNYEEVAIDSADVDDIMNVKGAALTVIDNDNDGYVNYVISVEKSLTHVSGVSSKNETTTLYGLPGDDVIDNEDIVTTATDLTKGDVVLVVQYGGRTYVEEPKTVTGEMELFNAKNKDDNKNYIKVGGEEYKQDGLEVLSNINKDNPVKFLISECDDKANGVQFDAQYDFFLDDFGNIVAFREVEGAPTQYALALDSAYSINGLTTTGQIKLLLADGTSKVYDVDMDATADRFEDLANSDDNSTKDSAVETWFGSAITDDNSMDAVLKFMGSDDATAAGAKTKGYASGNLVAYTIDDDEVVTFGPAELDDGVIVNGTSKNYIKGDNYTESGKSTFFHSSQTELKADVARGDVDLRLENSSVDTHTNSYGIDEETIIYYYNGSKGYVAVGYDNMAKMIDADKAGSIDNGKVRASVVAFDDATDVAEVIVLYTDQAKFGTDAYVYVMSVYDKSGSVYTYSVIDEEGNVLQMQSKTKGMAGKLCTYTTDGDYYVLEAQADCVSNSNKTAAADVANDVGLIVTTRTKYFKVYDFDKATDLMSDDETVKQSFVSGVNDNSNTDWERYADKALVIDVENTEADDKTAATTELTSGQYGIVVYNDDGQAEVVYVTDTYKMEVDVDAGDDDNANNDRITSTTVDGVKTASAGDYTTIAKAVANATTLPLSAEQAKNATVTITVDDSVTAHASGIFTTAAVAENGTDSDLTNRTDDIASSKNLNNGNVIVVKTWDGTFARYSAYIVEVQ